MARALKEASLGLDSHEIEVKVVELKIDFLEFLMQNNLDPDSTIFTNLDEIKIKDHKGGPKESAKSVKAAYQIFDFIHSSMKTILAESLQKDPPNNEHITKFIKDKLKPVKSLLYPGQNQDRPSQSPEQTSAEAQKGQARKR